MDDGKLRALLTAVDCGSFSKAAAQLGYTQSAMTHLVNKLEAEIGCTLLERDSQGIRLTDAGTIIAPEQAAKKLKEHIAQADVTSCADSPFCAELEK